MNFEEIETILNTLTQIKETFKEWKKLGDRNEERTKNKIYCRFI